MQLRPTPDVGTEHPREVEVEGKIELLANRIGVEPVVLAKTVEDAQVRPSEMHWKILRRRARRRWNGLRGHAPQGSGEHQNDDKESCGHYRVRFSLRMPRAGSVPMHNM